MEGDSTQCDCALMEGDSTQCDCALMEGDSTQCDCALMEGDSTQCDCALMEGDSTQCDCALMEGDSTQCDCAVIVKFAIFSGCRLYNRELQALRNRQTSELCVRLGERILMGLAWLGQIRLCDTSTAIYKCCV